MGPSALTLLPAVLIFSCGKLVFQTDATFYIETHSNGIRLYACSASRSGSAGSSTLPASYTTSQDIMCYEVEDITRQLEIYSAANFFLVVNPRREDGGRIILGSRSAELPLTVFVGVVTVPDEALDYPDLLDIDDYYLNRLRDKCVVTLPTRFLGPDINIESFVRYMGTADFHSIIHYMDPAYRRFARFGEIVRDMHSLYDRNTNHALRNFVSQAEQRMIRSDLTTAVGLLIQKMIDPCFVMSHVAEDHHIFMGGRFLTPMEVANSMCQSYCQLLGTTAALYTSAPQCGRGLHDGSCESKVCVCQKRTRLLQCTSAPPYVSMIKCSNDMRIELAGFVDMGL